MSACVEREGRRFPNGYSYFQIQGRSFLVHVIEWERENGRPVQDGMLIHHTCENKRCSNPDHLLEMTHSDHAAIHLRTNVCGSCGQEKDVIWGGRRRCSSCHKRVHASYRKRRKIA